MLFYNVVMLEVLLDFLFPPTEHERIVAHGTVLRAIPLRSHRSGTVPILSCIPDSNMLAHACVRTLKRTQNKKAARLLAALLADVLTEECADIRQYDVRTLAIVPMPLSKQKQRRRGFNQVAFVCSFLPEHLRTLVDASLLAQPLPTRDQRSLSRSKRTDNVRGVFAVPSTKRVRDMHIMLIDDVTTTGATLTEATRTLERAGATVTAIALVRA